MTLPSYADHDGLGLADLVAGSPPTSSMARTAA